MFRELRGGWCGWLGAECREWCEVRPDEKVRAFQIMGRIWVLANKWQVTEYFKVRIDMITLAF